MGKWCLQASSFIFDRIFVKLAGNQDRHKILDEFEFRPDRISHFGVMRPLGRIKFSIDLLWNLQDQLANLDQILYVSSLGWGKAAFRFWSRFHQNCSCHGNRKLPLTYNGENHVHANTFSFDPIFVNAGNKDRHRISDEFEFLPDRTTPFGVRCTTPFGVRCP